MLSCTYPKSAPKSHANVSNTDSRIYDSLNSNGTDQLFLKSLSFKFMIACKACLCHLLMQFLSSLYFINLPEEVLRSVLFCETFSAPKQPKCFQDLFLALKAFTYIG